MDRARRVHRGGARSSLRAAGETAVSVVPIVVPAALLTTGAATSWLLARWRVTSGQLLEARRDQQPLAHELPYWAFEDDGAMGVAIQVDLTYSIFFRLR